jgi:effector-binding domain-containing protein
MLDLQRDRATTQGEGTMATYEVVRREAVPYAAIPITVTMDSLATAVPLNGAVFDWLGQHDIAPAGPPFWKYNVIDMANQLELEVGVATATPVVADDRISAGELPAGRYLETTFHGHPDGLQQATGDLLAYADAEGLTFDRSESPSGDRWVARLEYYLSDPDEQPDMAQWDTTLSFKLRDED